MVQRNKAEEDEEAAKSTMEAEHRIMTAVYSPEIEAERKEREAFYLNLGVPLHDAKRLVSRILAAYV